MFTQTFVALALGSAANMSVVSAWDGVDTSKVSRLALLENTQTRTRRPSISREQLDEHRRLSKLVSEVFRDSRYHRFQIPYGEEDPAKLIEASQEQLAKFRAKMDGRVTPEMIAATKDPTNRSMERIVNNVTDWAANISAEISRREQILDGPDKSARQKILAQIQVLHLDEQLKYMAELFADNDSLRQTKQQSAALIARAGNFENLAQNVKAERAARIADTRLAPPVVRNAALERDATRALGESGRLRSEHPGYQILKVHLASSGWDVERNELTGRPIHRKRQVDFAIKTPDGKCYLAMELFEQQHLGGGRYGATRHLGGVQWEMLCQNV
ncbi:MAG: hypothetical protein AAF687_09630 [Pseudomonadota bacterium]